MDSRQQLDFPAKQIPVISYHRDLLFGNQRRGAGGESYPQEFSGCKYPSIALDQGYVPPWLFLDVFSGVVLLG